MGEDELRQTRGKLERNGLQGESDGTAQGHNPGWWIGYAALSHYKVGIQTTAPDLRQANDLLPVVHVDAGGHTGHSDHQHAAGHTTF